MTRWAGAVLLAVLAAAATARAQDASSPPPVPAEARAHLDRGEQLFAAGGFDAALAEYRAAYDAMGSHPSRYVVLFNVAQCHERLSQYELALRFYQRFLDEGGASDPDAAAVRTRIELLGGLLGTIAITLDWPDEIAPEARPPVTVWVGEREVGTAPGELRLPGGNHAVEVRAPGFEAEQRTVTLAARQRVAITFEMRSTAGGGLSPAVFWGSTIAAGVAVIAAGSLGVYALVRHDELASLEPPQDVLRTEADLDALRDVALAADVLFGTAALFGIASVILYFATDWSDDEADAPAPGAAARLRLAPYGGPDGLGLVLGGAL